MSRVLLDTAVFVYAVGRDSPFRAPCRSVLEQAADGVIAAAVTADLLMEFVHQRARRRGDRATAVRQAMEIPRAYLVLEPTLADARLALDLFARHPELHARDANLAAVALQRGIGHVVSPDEAFDVVPGLTRVDPLDAAGLAALAT